MDFTNKTNQELVSMRASASLDERISILLKSLVHHGEYDLVRGFMQKYTKLNNQITLETEVGDLDRDMAKEMASARTDEEALEILLHLLKLLGMKRTVAAFEK